LIYCELHKGKRKIEERPINGVVEIISKKEMCFFSCFMSSSPVGQKFNNTRRQKKNERNTEKQKGKRKKRQKETYK